MTCLHTISIVLGAICIVILAVGITVLVLTRRCFPYEKKIKDTLLEPTTKRDWNGGPKGCGHLI